MFCCPVERLRCSQQKGMKHRHRTVIENPKLHKSHHDPDTPTKLLLLPISFPVPVHRAGGILHGYYASCLLNLEVVGNEIAQLGDDHQVAPEHQTLDSSLPRLIPVSSASPRCLSVEVRFQFSLQMLCYSHMRRLLILEEVGRYWSVQKAESSNAIRDACEH